MTEGKPYLPWPGGDERIVVEEMLRDSLSGQWYECHEFVKRCVQKQAKNIPQDNWDDIVQDAMIRVNKSLPSFRYSCSFRTWLFSIARSSVVDTYRKLTRAGQHLTPPIDPHDYEEHPEEAVASITPETVEDECITRDELSEALIALQEYVSLHANPVRNGRILDIVLFEGHTLEDAARALGCSASVAGYVVRSAQRYVREKLGHRR